MGDPGSSSDDSPAGLSPGTRLGKYEVVRLLGAGGMGAVYEAAHTEIGKRVAIKVLSPTIAAVPGARARFLREAQLTSRVRHPNIVDVTDMGSDAGQTYLVMEFLRGEDLAQRMERAGPLLPQQVVDIMLPVCSAVVEAHRAGITHRDLKPQNIFLAEGPHTVQPKVLDFGISKGNDIVGEGTLTNTGALIGTPFYLAPEQIVDTRAAGPYSDQYALGVIMYECLTGTRPFEAENMFVVLQAIVVGNPLPPSQRRAGIPPALEAVVLRAMNLAPAARFPSTLALGHALLPFASQKMRSIWEEAFAGGAEPPAVGAAGVATEPGHVGPAAPREAPARATTGGETVGDISVRPSGSRKALVLIIAVVLLGLVAGVVLQRSRSTPAAVAPPAAGESPVPPVPSVPPIPAPAAAPAAPTAPEATSAPPVVPEPRAEGAHTDRPPPDVSHPKRVAPDKEAGKRRAAPRPPRRAPAQLPPPPSRNLNPNGAPVID